MKILVACHCKESYYIKRHLASQELDFINNLTGEINPPDAELFYIEIDENCPAHGDPNQYRNWEEIPNDFFDLIWFEYCPIAQIEKPLDQKIFIKFIRTAISKLNPDGMLITMRDNFLTAKNILEKAGLKKYISFNIVEQPYLPYLLYSQFTQHDKDNFYMIIKKNQSGGKYKKTIRKKKRKMKTRKLRKKI